MSSSVVAYMSLMAYLSLICGKNGYLIKYMYIASIAEDNKHSMTLRWFALLRLINSYLKDY